MKIQIDDKAYINVDKYNYTLVVLALRKDSRLNQSEPKYIERTIGYYTSPLRALIALRDYRISNRDIETDLTGFIALLQEQNERLEAQLTKIESKLEIRG